MLPNLSALTLRDDAAPTAMRGPAGQAKKRATPAIPPSERQLLAALDVTRPRPPRLSKQVRDLVPLVKRAYQDLRLVQRHMKEGTPGSMSPEQFEEEAIKRAKEVKELISAKVMKKKDLYAMIKERQLEEGIPVEETDEGERNVEKYGVRNPRMAQFSYEEQRVLLREFRKRARWSGVLTPELEELARAAAIVNHTPGLKALQERLKEVTRRINEAWRTNTSVPPEERVPLELKAEGKAASAELNAEIQRIEKSQTDAEVDNLRTLNERNEEGFRRAKRDPECDALRAQIRNQLREMAALVRAEGLGERYDAMDDTLKSLRMQLKECTLRKEGNAVDAECQKYRWWIEETRRELLNDRGPTHRLRYLMAMKRYEHMLRKCIWEHEPRLFGAPWSANNPCEELHTRLDKLYKQVKAIDKRGEAVSDEMRAEAEALMSEIDRCVKEREDAWRTPQGVPALLYDFEVGRPPPFEGEQEYPAPIPPPLEKWPEFPPPVPPMRKLGPYPRPTGPPRVLEILDSMRKLPGREDPQLVELEERYGGIPGVFELLKELRQTEDPDARLAILDRIKKTIELFEKKDAVHKAKIARQIKHLRMRRRNIKTKVLPTLPVGDIGRRRHVEGILEDIEKQIKALTAPSIFRPRLDLRAGGAGGDGDDDDDDEGERDYGAGWGGWFGDDAQDGPDEDYAGYAADDAEKEGEEGEEGKEQEGIVEEEELEDLQETMQDLREIGFGNDDDGAGPSGGEDDVFGGVFF